jgi:hypothetical protein
MTALLLPGDPAIEYPLMIDGTSLSVLPSEMDVTPSPVSTYLDMLDGGAREMQRRPYFDGIASYSDRYSFDVPYNALRGSNLMAMELLVARGGTHRLVMWRSRPFVFVCKAGVQRYYFPRFRKCAAHLYSGTVIGGHEAGGGAIVVSTALFPTVATLNDDPLTVTYAEGPTLVDPGVGGMVIARQPDASGVAADYTAIMLGDVVTDGDELIVWMPPAFEVSLRDPRQRISGLREHHSYTFVEV